MIEWTGQAKKDFSRPGLWIETVENDEYTLKFVMDIEQMRINEFTVLTLRFRPNTFEPAIERKSRSRFAYSQAVVSTTRSPKKIMPKLFKIPRKKNEVDFQVNKESRFLGYYI